VVGFQVHVSATGCLLVHRSPPVCGVSGCDRKPRSCGGPGPLDGVAPLKS